jgi:hypothetical protein
MGLLIDTPGQAETAASRVATRPPRLSFAGVCVWCGERECESPWCIESHARSRWMVCPECGGEALCGCECDCVFGVVEAPKREQASGRVQVGEVTVRVFDRGPEPDYHKDRALFRPWRPYEAELADEPAVSGLGWTPAEAIGRVLADRAAEWSSLWPTASSPLPAWTCSNGTRA